MFHNSDLHCNFHPVTHKILVQCLLKKPTNPIHIAVEMSTLGPSNLIEATERSTSKNKSAVKVNSISPHFGVKPFPDALDIVKMEAISAQLPQSQLGPTSESIKNS